MQSKLRMEEAVDSKRLTRESGEQEEAEGVCVCVCA